MNERSYAGQRRASPAMARRAARQPRSCGSATSAIAGRRKRRVRIAPRCSGDFLTPSPPGEKTTACGPGSGELCQPTRPPGIGDHLQRDVGRRKGVIEDTPHPFRLLRARRERPRSCCAAQCEYEFSPSEVNCHATRQRSCACNRGPVSRFSEGTNNAFALQKVLSRPCLSWVDPVEKGLVDIDES